MNLWEIPFKSLDDYPEESVPSALYAPAARLLLNARYDIKNIDNLSFKIIDIEGKELAWCLLCVDKSNNDGTQLLWGGGVPGIFWMSHEIPPSAFMVVYKFGQECIKKRLMQFGKGTILMNDFFNHGCLSPLAQEIMQSKNSTASLSFWHCIDLSASVETLKLMIRRRYKSIINKGLKIYTFSIYERMNFEQNAITSLHNCHITASGRDVYPSVFWEACAEIVQKGHGYVVNAHMNNCVKGSAFMICAGSRVYYTIGAFDRSLQETGLSHACMWTALLWAKRKNFSVFETGQTFFESCANTVSQKEMGIGFFKRGFGGRNLPVMTVQSHV